MKQQIPGGDITTPRAKKSFDGGRMVVSTAPNKQYVFLDRRMGVTWPSQYNAGYFSVWGLLDEQYRPMTLLAERKGFKHHAEMIKKLYAVAMAYRCSGIYADLSDDYSPIRYEILKIARRLTADAPAIYDSSDWASIDRGIQITERMNDMEAFVIPAGTMIDQEYSGLRPESLLINDRIKPWQRHPAVNAMAQVVCSWEMYPYKRRRPQAPDPWEETEGY